MDRRPCLIHSIRKLEGLWLAVFGFYLEKATGFRAFFPDHPELSEGKEDFLDLPFVSVGEWGGMKDCAEVSGPLSPQASALLRRAQDRRNQLRLWSFELLLNDQALLRLEDFTLCLVFPTDKELEELKGLGVDISRLEQVDLHPQVAQAVEPMSDDEVDVLREEFLRSFKPGPEGNEEPR